MMDASEITSQGFVTTQGLGPFSITVKPVGSVPGSGTTTPHCFNHSMALPNFSVSPLVLSFSEVFINPFRLYSKKTFIPPRVFVLSRLWLCINNTRFLVTSCHPKFVPCSCRLPRHPKSLRPVVLTLLLHHPRRALRPFKLPMTPNFCSSVRLP